MIFVSGHGTSSPFIARNYESKSTKKIIIISIFLCTWNQHFLRKMDLMSESEPEKEKKNRTQSPSPKSDRTLLTKFGVFLWWSAAEKYNCKMRQKHLSRPTAYRLICHRVKKSAAILRKKIMLLYAAHDYLRREHTYIVQKRSRNLKYK